MIPLSLRAARWLVALSLCAAASAHAWTDVASTDPAADGVAIGTGKQPSRPAKDGAVQPSTSERAGTRAAERAASQPVRKRWIVPAE